MLNRNHISLTNNSRVGSWLSPIRDIKINGENNKINSFSSRSIQSPSPRSEILGQVRESIISQIKHQNVCLENKLKLREQLNNIHNTQGLSSRENNVNNNVIKTNLHSQSKSPANKRYVAFKFDSVGLFDKIHKKTSESTNMSNTHTIEGVKKDDCSPRAEQLDDVFSKVKELFEEHNRKEKIWKWEKTQMLKKIENLENKIKVLEKNV